MKHPEISEKISYVCIKKSDMLSYKNIKNARQWKAAIGLYSDSFEKLHKEFIRIYKKLYINSWC